MVAGQHYGAYIVLLIFFLANAYFYIRLVGGLKPSRPFCWILGLVFFLLFLSLPVGKFVGRFDDNFFAYLITFISSMWMGFTIFFVTCAGLYDLFRFFWGKSAYGKRSILGEGLSFGPTLMISILAFVVFLGGCAIREARHISVTRLEISLRNLPPEMNGTSILQVSDVHYGMLSESSKLSALVKAINELNPDIVVFTGDLVDEKISHMEKMAEPLGQLHPRLGVYAVLGNHEYYAGAKRVAKILREANVRLLRNEMAVLPGGLQILGIDDPAGYKRMNEPRPNYDNLFSSLDSQKPSILLFHPPREFERAASSKIGLQLSGHTHGAQILPIRPFAEIWFPYVRGLHQIGESYLYVSRGVGTGGPPMRLGSSPEIVYISLKSSEKG